MIEIAAVVAFVVVTGSLVAAQVVVRKIGTTRTCFNVNQPSQSFHCGDL